MKTLSAPAPGLRFAAAVCAVLLVRAACAAPSGVPDAAPPASLDSPAAASVTVSVDLHKTHPISAYIYGNNAVGRASDLTRYVTLERAGGNRWPSYNWQSNPSNAATDSHYQNHPYLRAATPANAL